MTAASAIRADVRFREADRRARMTEMGRIPTPLAWGFLLTFRQTPDFSAIGVKEETSVSAIHQGKPLPNEPSGPVADVVIDPVALGDVGGLENHLGDLVVAGVREAPVDGAQAEDEAVDHLCRENARRRTGPAPHQPAPEAQGGCDADVEQPVQWQEDGGRIRSVGRDLHAQEDAPKLDDLLKTCDSAGPSQRIRRELDIRYREIFGEVDECGDSGERLGRPEHATG